MPTVCWEFRWQLSAECELKWLGYKSPENKVFNGNADRHLTIAAVAGTTVIKGLKWKKNVCLTKTCGFQGKAICRLNVRMDDNMPQQLWCTGASNKESWNSASNQIVKEFKEKPEGSIPQFYFTILLLPMQFIHALGIEQSLLRTWPHGNMIGVSTANPLNPHFNELFKYWLGIR